MWNIRAYIGYLASGELYIGFVACLICWVVAFVAFGTKGYRIMILVSIVFKATSMF